MPWFSHVRTRFWDAERYTEAQAEEFRQLRTAYTRYLAPVFGQELPLVLRPRTEGDDHYPRLTLAEEKNHRLPAVEASPANALQHFANSLLGTVRRYEIRRERRWYGKGHANDPTHLLMLYLKERFGALKAASSDAPTLAQVKALRSFLEALQRDPIFSDTEGQGSMTVLLNNVVSTLQVLEDRLTQDLQLSQAREHFAELKTGIVQLLDQATQYGFHSLAVGPRTEFACSVVTLQADVVD